MLSRLLVAGALAGGLAGVGFLGQAAPAAAPFDWSSIASGAVGSSPAAALAFWRLVKADKENAAQRAEIAKMHDEAVALVRELGPALTESTRTLADVRAAMESQVDRSRPADLERTLSKLTQQLDNLSRRQGGSR